MQPTANENVPVTREMITDELDKVLASLGVAEQEALGALTRVRMMKETVKRISAEYQASSGFSPEDRAEFFKKVTNLALSLSEANQVSEKTETED